MGSDLLSRYARGPKGEVLIDVTAPRVEDLYNDFDKRAPYRRRDLDPQLVDYLRECVREVGSHEFAIRFTFERPPGEEAEARVRASVPSYFDYMVMLKGRGIRRMVRRSVVFMGVGLGMVALAVWVNLTLATPPGGERSVVKAIVGEGLTIASWVAMWEALAIFLSEWVPRLQGKRVYERLAAAPLIIAASPASAEPAQHP